MSDKIRVLHAKYILPIIPVDTVLENHCVVIKNGVIQEIIKAVKGAKNTLKPSTKVSQKAFLCLGWSTRTVILQ